MIKLAVAGIVAIILLIAFLLIVRNKPDLWFWIFLNLFFDPGGYVAGYFDGVLLGPLHGKDIFITGMVICTFFADFNWKVIISDKFVSLFLTFLILYAVYFFVVYGGVMPYLHNDFDYATFLIKNRSFLYGFIIFFAVYAFSLKNIYYFYTTTLAVGTISLTLFFITLTTGIDLIPVSQSARYSGDEMQRISMLGYGMFYILFPISLITYLLSHKIKIELKYKYVLYYSGLIMLITLLITLTRRTQIDIIASVLIIIFLISYLFRSGKLSEIIKVFVPSLLLVLILAFIFPNYINYIATIGQDTFLLMTTGEDSRGETDYRVRGSEDLEITKKYIGENLIFGTGYTYLHWGRGFATSNRGDTFAIAADAAGEVPIYYLLFGYGLAGALLMLPLYYFMIKLFFNLSRSLRAMLINYLKEPLLIIFTVYILLYLIGKFTYRFYTLSLDFTGEYFSTTGLFMGLGFALNRKLIFNAVVSVTDKNLGR